MTGQSANEKKATANDASLLDALRGALDADDAACPSLRDAIFAFVQTRRSLADAPEEVIVALKAHVQRVSLADSAVEESELVDRVVKWGIDAYYR